MSRSSSSLLHALRAGNFNGCCVMFRNDPQLTRLV